MKTMRGLRTVTAVWVLSLTVGLAGSAWAQGSPPPNAGKESRLGQRAGANAGGGGTAGPTAGEELTALDQFLTMSDGELDAVQKAVAKVRSMSPEERATLRATLRTYRSLPESQRLRLRCEWRDATERREWSERMRAKTDAERTAIQTDLQSLPPEERAARRQHWLRVWQEAERAVKNPPDES